VQAALDISNIQPLKVNWERRNKNKIAYAQDVNTCPSAGAIIFRVPFCILGNCIPCSYAAVAGISTFLINSNLVKIHVLM
jgi:hypothetical protein